ncbi:MAG: NADH-quinone oxidoreductase subunit J [Gammaproteobacteria bacterium]
MLTITRVNAMHALLYLVVSLLAVAGVFFILGAPFAAMLEIIVYAGAIIVLFVFAVMMLNLGDVSIEQERRWLSPDLWLGPSILSAILLAELVYRLSIGDLGAPPGEPVGAAAVAARLFGPYLLAVELASMLLLAGLVGAYRIGRILDERTAERTSSAEREPVAAGADAPQRVEATAASVFAHDGEGE